MTYEFVKLHGLGNDFVVIDDFSQEIDLTEQQVRQLCDRHFGIGADGVILVRPSQKADCVAYMHYINSDGTLAEMCGNGVRCFAKYLVDREFVSANENSFNADTMAGVRPISFTRDNEGNLDLATVNMGQPILAAGDVPTTLSETATSPAGVFVKEASLDSPWGTFSFTCVSMGNPHAICFVDDWECLADELFTDPGKKSLSTFRVDMVGSLFESHEVFPQKTNVEFAHVDGRGIAMRVYERGCGETFACGTGACATLVAARLTDRSACENDVHLLGGTLHIEWNENNNVMMTGPAKEAFSGTVEA